MPVEMALWRMTSGGAIPVTYQPLDFEHRLEELLVEDPSMVGLAILVIGRQVPTSYAWERSPGRCCRWQT